jgi:DNA-binding beta-propeller fold protein YncE
MKQLHVLFAIFLCLIAFSAISQIRNGSADDREKLEELSRKFNGIVFPENAVWLNTQRREIFSEAKRVYLLSKWSPISLESRQNLADIDRIVKANPEIQVILVFEPQSVAEQDTSMIRQAIIMERINYPVVLLSDKERMEALKSDCFPYTVFVRYDGIPMRDRCGTGIFNELNPFITEAMSLFRQTNVISRSSSGSRDAEERFSFAKPVLGYPTFMSADEAEDRLFVSSTAENKVLILSVQGEVLDVIGSGERGNAPGSFEACAFNKPLGLAYDSGGSRLFIADSENHSIKVADLITREVRLFAGSGSRSEGSMPPEADSKTSMAYPWDLELLGDRLLITMSGDNSIWEYSTFGAKGKRLLGSGAKGNIIGKTKSTLLSEPMALATDRVGNIAYTVSGSPEIQFWNLKKTSSLLDSALKKSMKIDFDLPVYPQGLLYHGSSWFVCDTYNRRILKLDKQGEWEVAAGSGSAGWNDGPAVTASFRAPWDMVLLKGKLYISDCFNSLIRVYNPADGKINTLAVSKTDVITERIPALVDRSSTIYTNSLELEEGENTVVVEFEIPEHLELVRSGRNEAFALDDQYNELLAFDPFEGSIVFSAQGTPSNLHLTFELYLEYRLKEKPEARFYRTARVFIPFTGGSEALPAGSVIKISPMDLLTF